MMQRTISRNTTAPAVAMQAPRSNAVRTVAFRRATPHRARAATIRVQAAGAPPTVADAKARFQQAFPKPLPGLYSTVVMELLVQQHLYRWNASYSYNAVTSLGVVSIFDQVLGNMPEAERAEVFNAYITALQEDPQQYRNDAAALEAWAKGLSSASDVTPAADGGEGQQALARVAEGVKNNQFLYTKFFAVGLFRMLELAGGKDPKALATVVAALGIPQERVNADLLTYKGVLSKLQAAKEIMKEFLEREKRKAAERAAAKAAKAAGGEQPVEA